jgi:ABC transporter
VFPELDAPRTRRAGALSGGQQQMLAIGRALVARARILLLDEPSQGLAPVVPERLAASLRQLHESGILSFARTCTDRRSFGFVPLPTTLASDISGHAWSGRVQRQTYSPVAVECWPVGGVDYLLGEAAEEEGEGLALDVALDRVHAA